MTSLPPEDVPQLGTCETENRLHREHECDNWKPVAEPENQPELCVSCGGTAEKPKTRLAGCSDDLCWSKFHEVENQPCPREIAAIAYQICGALNAPVRILDYFSAIAQGEHADNPLPFSPDEIGGADALPDERAEFEKWLFTQWPDLERSAIQLRTVGNYAGEYFDGRVNAAWLAWQARARAPQPAGSGKGSDDVDNYVLPTSADSSVAVDTLRTQAPVAPSKLSAPTIPEQAETFLRRKHAEIAARYHPNSTTCLLCMSTGTWLDGNPQQLAEFAREYASSSNAALQSDLKNAVRACKELREDNAEWDEANKELTDKVSALEGQLREAQKAHQEAFNIGIDKQKDRERLQEALRQTEEWLLKAQFQSTNGGMSACIQSALVFVRSAALGDPKQKEKI